MRVVIFAVLVLFAQGAWAQQEPVPAKERFRLFKHRLSKKFQKADSLKVQLRQKATKQTQSDTIRRKNRFSGIGQTAGSVNNTRHGSDSIRKTALTSLQSPDTTKQVSQYANRLAQQKDSLINVAALRGQTPNVPGDSINKTLGKLSDRINEKVENIPGRLAQQKDSTGLPSPVRKLQEKANGNIDIKFPDGSKLPLDKAGLPEGNRKSDNPLAGLSSTDLKVPQSASDGVAPNIPGIDPENPTQQGLPDLDVSGKINLPKPDVPELDGAGNLKEKLNLPADLDVKKPDSSQIKELSGRALEDERIKAYAEPVAQVSDRLDPYKKNLDSLTVRDAGNIAAEELEDNAGKIGAVGDIDANVKKARAAMATPQQAALIQRYQDKKILREEMLRKSKNVVNDKITAATPQVTEQQKNFAKARRLNSSVPSVRNMSAKRKDELRERPFYERIVPGIAFQTFSGSVFALDFAPQVAYRINTRWSVGAGGIYRAGFDKKYELFMQGQGISGFRIFTDCRIVKGLFLHGEYEKITASNRFAYSDQLRSSSFNNACIGLGKRYPISRKFYGSLIALYKAELSGHLPSSSKFNLRIVFEYKTKKVRKPTDL